jgi:hypothetical protein
LASNPQTGITAVGTLTSLTVSNNSVLASVDVTGVATAATFEPDGDTASGDNAAIGYTSVEGLILTGQGSTNDITIKNDADSDVIEIPTGTTNVTVAGNLGVGGTVTAPTFVGAVNGNATTATTLRDERAISMTGDVTASGVNFNGSTAIALNASLADSAVTTAKIDVSAVTTDKIANDAVTYAKLQNLGTADRVLGSTTTGIIGEVQIVADMIASNAVTTNKINNSAVTLAKIANVTGNTVLVRDASGSGVITAKSVGDTQILIGDGTGFTAASLSGDVTMTNAGVTNIGADKVGSPELNTLREFTLKDSGGTAIFTMYGAGA